MTKDMFYKNIVSTLFYLVCWIIIEACTLCACQSLIPGPEGAKKIISLKLNTDNGSQLLYYFVWTSIVPYEPLTSLIAALLYLNITAEFCSIVELTFNIILISEYDKKLISCMTSWLLLNATAACEHWNEVHHLYNYNYSWRPISKNK